MHMTGLQCIINWSRPLDRLATIFNVTVTTIFIYWYCHWITLILPLLSREIVWPSNMKYLAWFLHRTIIQLTLLSRAPTYIFCFTHRLCWCVHSVCAYKRYSLAALTCSKASTTYSNCAQSTLYWAPHPTAPTASTALNTDVLFSSIVHLLYCIILCYTVMQCIVLYCITHYDGTLNCNALWLCSMYCTVLHIMHYAGILNCKQCFVRGVVQCNALYYTVMH
jgi:hypothetical protein